MNTERPEVKKITLRTEMWGIKVNAEAEKP